MFPQVPPDLQRLAAATAGHREGWAWLQAGDLRNADRSFSEVLKRQPGFYPSEAGIGYLSLARGDQKRALEWFDRALSDSQSYAPALVGRGEALLGLQREAEALQAFEAALEADPSLSALRSRVEVLRFRGLQDSVASARAAASAGRLEEARAAYQRALAASPESPFLYRELAAIERALGQNDMALQHVKEAIARDPSDGTAHLLLGDLMEQQGSLDEAAAALERAKALGVSESNLDERLEQLKKRAALARLPAEYQAIPEASRITRADLAALIAIRLDQVVRAARRPDPVLVTDARGTWAEPWIASVTRAALMEVYSNHTFQPRAVVRRSDLAQTASRVLAVIASRDPDLAKRWHDEAVTFTDIGPGHLSYRAAAIAVAAGILTPTEGGGFQPSRPVSGAEAIEAVSRLEALASGISAKGSR
jgi:tetratricopeptide (TPR) repeat protein